jgi:predicted secreted protein
MRNQNYLFTMVLLATHSIMAMYKEPITVRQGYIFMIKLPSAPKTSYDWFFGNEKELKDYVQLIQSEFISSHSLGSGQIGKKIFRFRALKDGRLTIKMVKRKSWEKNEVDHKLIKIHIKRADLGTSTSK